MLFISILMRLEHNFFSIYQVCSVNQRCFYPEIQTTPIWGNHLYLSKYSSSLIIQLSHITISCSCSGVLQREQENVHTVHNKEKSSYST